MCGGVAPLAVEGKVLGSPRGYWGAGALRVTEHGALRGASPYPASHRAQHSVMCRASALRVTELGALRCVKPVLCDVPSSTL